MADCFEGIVTASTLGPEFELGTTTPGKITVNVNGTTVVRHPTTGELSVNACEVIKAATTGAATAKVTGDKISVVDSTGACRVRDLDMCVVIETDATLIGAGTLLDPLRVDICQVRGRLTVRNAATTGTLITTSDRVVIVNTASGNATFNLAAPGTCDPVDFHISKSHGANTLTILPQAGGTIVGGASLVVPTGISVFGAPPSVHIVWTGTDWRVL